MEWLLGGESQEEKQMAELEARVGELVREKAALQRSLELAWRLIASLRDVNADLDAKQLRRGR
jgi:hypothetical protein